MGFTNAPKNIALDAIGAQAVWISAHNADPGSNGTGEVSTARKATTWAAASAAAKQGSQVALDIPAGGNVTHWGLWTAASGGAFYYGNATSATEVYGGSGQYMFTPTMIATG